jgi:bacteriorhodopsin
MPPKYSSSALWAGVGLIGGAVYFFLAAISLISPPATEVVAALLSAIIGFVMLSAGTTLIRTYVVTRVAEQQENVAEAKKVPVQ